ncbi:diaminopimelate epimerase [Gordonia pseudamarae]|jgi:diaminopimelate epimerase|uniref:Diaminopimelate epimerase n=1 Tax=Gordonia pseudamarae TaxID=2831662 RepID=A0ABX6IM05_9ACTN|nr:MULTISPECIES: hypothetical protein [Gordonia]MBD0023768.1 diaminopimelate epimerase [Gordonia sp. (in: high G+C Gram-positive bacteria)]QHN28077.1 diaminopimelate epimerase [Gordonia pseudamarae]QHN36939.1 diaminopimelate epimerase [Gordonia pseudamarae]
MRELEFVKLDPTQNVTVLVKTQHPSAEYVAIAQSLMGYAHVHAEQVGFVELSSHPEALARIQMAAGEFCGNACMSLAASIAHDSELAEGMSTSVCIESSGTDDLINCEVRRANRRYECNVSMPIPLAVTVSDNTILGGGWGIVLYQEGIHIVAECRPDDSDTRRFAAALAAAIAPVREFSLVGVMLYHPGTGSVHPLIHIPALGSMIWERGCCSGVASVGAYLAHKNNRSVAATMRLPGGPMRVAAEIDGKGISRLVVEGHVRIVARGQAYLADDQMEEALVGDAIDRSHVGAPAYT